MNSAIIVALPIESELFRRKGAMTPAGVALILAALFEREL